MPTIDRRLLDPDGVPEISENFNRVLNLVDSATGKPGPAGKDGVGIASITGSIDGENNITITINLTEGDPQVIKGKITPPAGA